MMMTKKNKRNNEQLDLLSMEKIFLEQTEQRYKKILALFEEEKSILSALNTDTKNNNQNSESLLIEKIQLLTKYVNLKDDTLKQYRQDIEKMNDNNKVNEMKVANLTNELKNSQESVESLTQQNAKLEQKLQAYFKFDEQKLQDRSDSDRNMKELLKKSVSTSNTVRGRSGTFHDEMSSPRNRQGSDTARKMADNVVAQEEYLSELNKLRQEQERMKKLEKKRTQNEFESEKISMSNEATNVDKKKRITI